MKHSIPKGDKKRKKQVMAEIAELEAEQKQRHEKELEEFNKDIKLVRESPTGWKIL